MLKKIALQYLILASVAGAFLVSCKRDAENDSIKELNLKQRMVQGEISKSFENGSTYLSVYSKIYSFTEHKAHDLTATISMRNTSRGDTLFIEQAEYFDTKGNSIRKYFPKPVFLTPMETLEIVINEKDNDGGSGGNFIIDWKMMPSSSEPLFEGVMISTSGQQGLSFTTQGKRIK